MQTFINARNNKPHLQPRKIWTLKGRSKFLNYKTSAVLSDSHTTHGSDKTFKKFKLGQCRALQNILPRKGDGTRTSVSADYPQNIFNIRNLCRYVSASRSQRNFSNTWRNLTILLRTFHIFKAVTIFLTNILRYSCLVIENLI